MMKNSTKPETCTGKIFGELETLLTLKPGITFMNYKTHEGYTQQIKLIKL